MDHCFGRVLSLIWKLCILALFQNVDTAQHGYFMKQYCNVNEINIKIDLKQQSVLVF